MPRQILLYAAHLLGVVGIVIEAGGTESRAVYIDILDFSVRVLVTTRTVAPPA